MDVHLKKVIHYGMHKEQFSHLYKPKNRKNIPVVIVIHGGYWKDNHSLESYATKAIVDYLKSFKVAIWNLEYRRMDTEGHNIKAPWPSIFKDIADGVDHLRNIKDEECLDLNRVLIIGHSAGGHLATWAAFRRNISTGSILFQQNPLAIQRVISIAGILNLFATDDVSQPVQISRLMGGSQKDCFDRYSACDPSTLFSPETNLTVVHGEQDTCVNISQALHFCEKTKGRVKPLIIPHADHFTMLPHQGYWVESQWQQIKQLVKAEVRMLF